MPRRRKYTNAHTLSVDTWGQVVVNLFDNPRKVFMLLCAVKGLHFNDEWWARYWERHRSYNIARNHRPHYYLGYEPSRPGQCKVLLRLVYGMFCSQCGCRYHHTIFEPMRMRICCECVRDCHISNVVLWHEYGLALEPIVAKYRFVVKHTTLQYYTNPNQILYITRNPVDLDFKCKRKMVFFWKPDLQRLFDFNQLRAEQVHRVQCINTIKAAFKRVYANRVRGRYLVESLHTNDVLRIIRPLCPPNIMWGTNLSQAYLVSPGARLVSPDINLDLALRNPRPLPVIADDEVTLKTMVSKLKLDKDTLQSKINEWRGEKPIQLIAHEVFKV